MVLDLLYLVLTYLTYSNFYFLTLPLITLTYTWVFFFKTSINTARSEHLDKTTHLNIIGLGSNNYLTYTHFYIYMTSLHILNLFFIRGKNFILWFEHLILTNFIINVVVFFFYLSFLLVLLLVAVIKKNNLTKGVDYLFALINLTILLPYIFFSSTVFTFLFIIEILSTILLYKLVSSQIWFKTQDLNKFYKGISRQNPTNYINMVFFQYWVMFFSTIFIVYFYICVFYIYGSSNWVAIQLLEKFFKNKQLFVDTFYKSILYGIFLSSVFFKLGVTPFHLFKVEVYKGLPLLSILFYTTYYFTIFFVFFLYLLSEYLGYFVPQFYTLLSTSIVFGFCYVILLLFDLNLIKAFFTYSTVINTVGLLLLFITLITI